MSRGTDVAQPKGASHLTVLNADQHRGLCEMCSYDAEHITLDPPC